jgi:hypothetical protein
MPTSSPPEFGRIVWADLADANGIRKLRPAVVVTSNDRIAPNRPVELIAITSRLPDPLPDDHVLLPWHAQGHPRTGLNRKCAAVCRWLCRALPEDIKEFAGIVPGKTLLKIVDKIAEFQKSIDGTSGPH